MPRRPRSVALCVFEPYAKYQTSSAGSAMLRLQQLRDDTIGVFHRHEVPETVELDEAPLGTAADGLRVGDGPVRLALAARACPHDGERQRDRLRRVDDDVAGHPVLVDLGLDVARTPHGERAVGIRDEA